MKKPDLLMLIAIWEFITAFFAFLGLLAVIILSFIVPVNRSGLGSGPYFPGNIYIYIGLSIAVVLLTAYIILALIAGIGLLRGREWGRIASIILAALGLFSIPVGTITGILIIIYLTQTPVKNYFNQPTGTGILPFNTSITPQTEAVPDLSTPTTVPPDASVPNSHNDNAAATN